MLEWKNEYNENIRKSKEVGLEHIYKFNTSKTEKTEKIEKTEKTEKIERVNYNFDVNILSNKYVVEPFKLVSYKKGDFFKKHKDSMPDVSMIGTIILSLVSDYEGGSLIVEHFGNKLSFDLKAGEWVFLYGDCDHEIMPVTNGMRITMVFRVYSTKIAVFNTVNNNRYERCKIFVDALLRYMEQKKKDIQ